MSDTLQQKLEQFGLVPIHISLDNDVVALTKEFEISIEFDGINFWCQVGTRIQRLIKTDADWQAVAGFVKFLKGE